MPGRWSTEHDRHELLDLDTCEPCQLIHFHVPNERE